MIYSNLSKAVRLLFDAILKTNFTIWVSWMSISQDFSNTQKMYSNLTYWIYIDKSLQIWSKLVFNITSLR